MTNLTSIKGTATRCKRNVKSHFEQVPTTIFNYLKLGLISGNDLAIYIRLLKLDNPEIGYAFPTTKQLALEVGISDRTAKQSIKTLERVGLIKIEKAKKYANKNVYFVGLPHDEEGLKKQMPHLFAEYERKKAMYNSEAAQDKQRLEDYRDQQN